MGCPAACPSPSCHSAPAAFRLQMGRPTGQAVQWTPVARWTVGRARSRTPWQRRAVHATQSSPAAGQGTMGTLQPREQRGAPDSCSQRSMIGVGQAALPLTVRRSCACRQGPGQCNSHATSNPTHARAARTTHAYRSPTASPPTPRSPAARRAPTHPARCSRCLLLLRCIHLVVSRQQLAVHGGDLQARQQPSGVTATQIAERRGGRTAERRGASSQEQWGMQGRPCQAHAGQAQAPASGEPRPPRAAPSLS